MEYWNIESRSHIASGLETAQAVMDFEEMRNAYLRATELKGDDVKGQLGASTRVVRRKDLKPRKELSDEALLRSAQRAAERWKKKQ